MWELVFSIANMRDVFWSTGNVNEESESGSCAGFANQPCRGDFGEVKLGLRRAELRGAKQGIVDFNKYQNQRFLRKPKPTHPADCCVFLDNSERGLYTRGAVWKTGDKWKLPGKRRTVATRTKNYVKRMSEGTQDRSVLNDEVAEGSDAQRPVRVGF